MANKIEQIANKQKQAAAVKQNADAERFAKKVADKVVGGIGDLSFKDSIAQLATSVAEAIVVSNKSFDESLKDNFTQLLSAVKENKPDASQVELSVKIGEQLAALEGTFNSLEAPTVNVSGISVDDLRAEVAKIINRLPVDNQRIVTLSYENAMPDKFISVRLTDGLNWYKASGIGGGGGGISNEQIAKLQGFPIPEYDEIELDYTGENLTGVIYKKETATVGTLTLSYDGDKLTGVALS